MKLLLIDNYDSFTYNLVQYFGELKLESELEIQIFRNDQVSVAELSDLKPDYLVISPGPGTPNEGGISMEAIRFFSGKIPVLGVCLGHQCIATVFGGMVIRAPQPVHGKTGMIEHVQVDLFENMPNPFPATRYHSLVVERDTLPAELEVIAVLQSDPQIIMGLKHREYPTFGVQFHPESIFTVPGKQVLTNFIKIGIGYCGAPCV